MDDQRSATRRRVLRAAGATGTGALVAGCAGDTAGGDPVERQFSILSDRGLVGEYECTPLTLDTDTRSPTVQVECSAYALRARDGQLPVVPIVIGLCRQETAWPPASVDAQTADSGWRLTLELSAESPPGPLSTVPITATA